MPIHSPLLADAEGLPTKIADPGRTSPRPDKKTHRHPQAWPSSYSCTISLLQHRCSWCAVMEPYHWLVAAEKPQESCCALFLMQARIQRWSSSSAPRLTRLQLLECRHEVSCPSRVSMSGLGLCEVVWGGLMGDPLGVTSTRERRNKRAARQVSVWQASNSVAAAVPSPKAGMRGAQNARDSACATGGPVKLELAELAEQAESAESSDLISHPNLGMLVTAVLSSPGWDFPHFSKLCDAAVASPERSRARPTAARSLLNIAVRESEEPRSTLSAGICWISDLLALCCCNWYWPALP